MHALSRNDTYHKSMPAARQLFFNAPLESMSDNEHVAPAQTLWATLGAGKHKKAVATICQL